MSDEKLKLKDFDPATISNADKTLLTLPTVLRPIRDDLILLGPARTLELPEDDFLSVIAVLDEAIEGEVVVVKCQQSKKAVCGEMLVAEAARKKLGGIVIVGGSRDTAAVKEISVPVYSSFFNPKAGTAHLLFPRQTQLSFDGGTVCPGDILFGDGDGIVVIPKGLDLTKILEAAAKIKASEKAAVASMQSGDSFASQLNFKQHVAAIQSGKRSQLSFIS